MSNIKVSIITVCYNSEKTIRRTMESIVSQTYKNIEHIIVDGKSTDSTLDIVYELEPLYHDNIRIISEKDHGIYNAMNKGIAMATGELIGILNSDDYYENDAVEKIIKNYEGNPYKILYGMCRCLKGDEEQFVSIISHNRLEEEMIAHPACFVPKQIYDEFGLYDETYISVADYEFMLRMNRNSKISFQPVYEIIVNFTLGGMSGTSAAYYDLLKLKRAYHHITNRQYRYQFLKSKLYDILVKR